MTHGPFDIAAAFRDKQANMLASYSATRDLTHRPSTFGDKFETEWIDLLRGFLPERYVVGPIFAVDADGAVSEQIDVAVYDRQSSPLWFGALDGYDFVPVEAVYAAFEVKPTINTTYIASARQKIASVRRLRRTSAPIRHAGGVFAASDPSAKHLIGGLLAANVGWTTREVIIEKLRAHLPAVGSEDSLDIGLAFDAIAFDYTREPVQAGGRRVQVPLKFSHEGDQLIYFAIRLFRQLQQLGTVLAIDMSQYEEALVGGL